MTLLDIHILLYCYEHKYLFHIIELRSQNIEEELPVLLPSNLVFVITMYLYYSKHIHVNSLVKEVKAPLVVVVYYDNNVSLRTSGQTTSGHANDIQMNLHSLNKNRQKTRALRNC